MVLLTASLITAISVPFPIRDELSLTLSAREHDFGKWTPANSQKWICELIEIQKSRLINRKRRPNMDSNETQTERRKGPADRTHRSEARAAKTGVHDRRKTIARTSRTTRDE
jgi:hypothetical protein